MSTECIKQVKYDKSNGNYHKFSNNDKVNQTIHNLSIRKTFPAQQSCKNKTFNSNLPKDCNMADKFEPYEPKSLTLSSTN